MLENMIHKQLSGQIIHAAMTILNELKPGLDEKVYENALRIELEARGHRIDQQQRYPVYYRGIEVGLLIPDIVVDNLVIVDPKVVVNFNDHHLAQMTGYLAITQLELALLLNFKYARLQWKRVVRSLSAISA